MTKMGWWWLRENDDIPDSDCFAFNKLYHVHLRHGIWQKCDEKEIFVLMMSYFIHSFTKAKHDIILAERRVVSLFCRLSSARFKTKIIIEINNFSRWVVPKWNTYSLYVHRFTYVEMWCHQKSIGPPQQPSEMAFLAFLCFLHKLREITKSFSRVF